MTTPEFATLKAELEQTLAPGIIKKIEMYLSTALSQPKDEKPANLRTLTQTEAAKRIGKSRITIIRYIKQGKLKTIPSPSNHPWILEESLEELFSGKAAA